MNNFVTRYWRGEGPLWRAYWLYGVAGSLALVAALGAPMLHDLKISVPYYLGAAIVTAAYTIWILVAVWRCAFNVKDSLWGYLARALTVFWSLNMLFVAVFLGLDLKF